MRRADNGNGTFTNPIIFADYPDPDIIRVEENFYLVSSSFTDVPVARGGTIEVRLDSCEGELIGACEIPGNGERNQWLCPWLTFTCKTVHVTGVRTLCLKFTGGEGYLMRLDSFTFAASV